MSVLADAGDLDRAELVIQRIPLRSNSVARRRPDPDHLPPPPDAARTEAVITLARAAARLRKVDRAVGIARRPSTQWSHARAVALLDVARAVSVYNPEQARSIALEASQIIRDVYVSPGGWVAARPSLRVARAAGAARTRRVRAQARASAEDAPFQAAVAHAIREAIIQGDRELAVRYTAGLLAGPAWLRALPKLVTLDAAAVARALDVFLAQLPAPSADGEAASEQ